MLLPTGLSGDIAHDSLHMRRYPYIDVVVERRMFRHGKEALELNLVPATIPL